MRIIALLTLFLTHSVFACEIQDLRKNVFSHFKKQFPVESQLGERLGVSTLKEMYLTDSMLRIRGEDFFITRLVLNILWANGKEEKKDVMIAAVVDISRCRIESFETDDILGSTVSRF